MIVVKKVFEDAAVDQLKALFKVYMSQAAGPGEEEALRHLAAGVKHTQDSLSRVASVIEGDPADAA